MNTTTNKPADMTSDAAFEAAKVDFDRAKKAVRRNWTEETRVAFKAAAAHLQAVGDARVAQQEATYAAMRSEAMAS